jgi:hypothetical protein
MSSIRRSSLISIKLGLLTVIGASFRSLPLKRRQDNASECPFEPILRLKLRRNRSRHALSASQDALMSVPAGSN